MISAMAEQPRNNSAGPSAVAADRATGVMILWVLAVRCLASRALARALAANPRLPRPLLWSLALRRWDVRAAVAANPRCPRLLLRIMLGSTDWAVGAAVARNPAASPRLLKLLANAALPCVKMYLAANPALTSPVADRLLADRDPYVRGVAAAHPAASAAALRRLADGMNEQAWILRRIAVNRSCPAELADQLLTWITLGGPGNADPAFDPLECTGHPGDTSVPEYTWYRDEAKRTEDELHPLWRVRAAILPVTGRVSKRRGWRLARDPRPEVRRAIAGATRLSLDLRVELRHDADPVTARLADAESAVPGTHVARDRRTVRIIIGLAVPIAIAGAGFNILAENHLSPKPSATVISGMPVVTKLVRQLPGGGTLTCGDAADSPPVPVVLITAGSTTLVLDVTGSIASFDGQVQHPEVTVAPGQSDQFELLSGPSALSVTASPSAGTVVSVSGCGR